MTLQRVNALLDDVATATARALADFEALAVRAIELQADAAEDLKELRQWMGLVSMDMGLLTGNVDRPTIDGHDVRMDAMREGIGEITLAEARASILLKSVISVRNVLDAGVRHFTGVDALTDTFDSTSELVQSAVSEAREAERRRLASEIHDGPAQVLANAVNLVEVTEHVAKRHPEQIGDELRQVRQFLKEGVDEVRQFMQDLRPTILEVLGLEESLNQLTSKYCARWGIKSAFRRDGAPLPKLLPLQELQTYRILQESLHNVRKHAGQDVSVEVTVRSDPRLLRMTIADDGVGFDPLLVAPKVSSGEGILGMRERAASVHGQITIESRTGEGSTVTFNLPHDGKADSTQSRPSDPGPGGL